MKHRILVLTLAVIVGFTSCGKDKELIEVTIPEPEKVEKIAMGNPADVKADDAEGAFQTKGLSVHNFTKYAVFNHYSCSFVFFTGFWMPSY